MLTVPSSANSQAAPQVRPPDPTFLMMAAAQMHSEGRLVDDSVPGPATTRKNDLPTTPPPEPPHKYWPSNGDRRDGPSMMT